MHRVAARGLAAVRSAVVAVAAVLSLHPAWAQTATQPAAAIARQSDDAAGQVAQQRSDAAAAIGQDASDAAGSVAQRASDAAGSIARQSTDAADATVPRTPAPLAPNPEFANFPRYAGTLGARHIVLRLGKKTDDPTGVHGEYQFADTGEVVLVAGDREGDVLEIEDSDDGSTISGNWVGRFAADGTLAGDRMNPDDSDPQPFVLHPLASPSPTQ
nr:hypothetical protein [Trinickia dinghuensis]